MIAAGDIAPGRAKNPSGGVRLEVCSGNCQPFRYDPIAILQGGSSLGQMRIHELGKKPIAIGWRKEAGGERRRGKELGLSREGG